MIIRIRSHILLITDTDLEVMLGPAQLLQHQSPGLPANATVALLPGAQQEVVVSGLVSEPAD